MWNTIVLWSWGQHGVCKENFQLWLITNVSQLPLGSSPAIPTVHLFFLVFPQTFENCCNENFAMHVTWSLLISLCDPLVSRPNRVHPIATTRLLPPPGHFEPNRSPHTPTTSFRVRPLVIHLHCVFSSAIACFAPPSPQIEPERSSPTSTMSIRA